MKFEIDDKLIHAGTGGKTFDPSQAAVIFLHGAGMDQSCWQLQSRWFAWHGWSVLALDLPGHGGSESGPLATIEEAAQWVKSVITHFGLTDVSLVGHSMGAAIALEVAADLGSEIKILALLGAAEEMPVNPELLAAAKENDPLAIEMISAWGHSTKAKLGANKVPGIWMLGGTRKLLAMSAPGVLHNDLKACAEWKSGAKSAESVTAKSLVVIGKQDLMTPPKKALSLAGRIASCQSIIIPNCGHLMMQEAPDAVLDALIETFEAA